jgi:hypothetical protein
MHTGGTLLNVCGNQTTFRKVALADDLVAFNLNDFIPLGQVGQLKLCLLLVAKAVDMVSVTNSEHDNFLS